MHKIVAFFISLMPVFFFLYFSDSGHSKTKNGHVAASSSSFGWGKNCVAW